MSACRVLASILHIAHILPLYMYNVRRGVAAPQRQAEWLYRIPKVYSEIVFLVRLYLCQVTQLPSGPTASPLEANSSDFCCCSNCGIRSEPQTGIELIEGGRGGGVRNSQHHTEQMRCYFTYRTVTARGAAKQNIHRIHVVLPAHSNKEELTTRAEFGVDRSLWGHYGWGTPR